MIIFSAAELIWSHVALHLSKFGASRCLMFAMVFLLFRLLSLKHRAPMHRISHNVFVDAFVNA